MTSRALLALALVALLAPPASALSADEQALLDRVRGIARAPTEDFGPLGEALGAPDPGYRYQLAFLSYGLCSVASAAPEVRAEARALMVRLVEKMEHPKALAYWKALGYEGDGLARANVMYRGHLDLMYALARDRFGETRFDERFHALSRALFEEMTAEQPICCEPDRLFLQCNTVAALALWLHDRAFGTRWAVAGRRALAFARERMPLEGTSLVRDEWRPSTGASSLKMAGYANAWAIAFLAPIPDLEADARTMFADWRRTFALEGRFLAAARGAPPGVPLEIEELLGSTLLATTFGTAAAADFDAPLHRRLERTVLAIDLVLGEAETSLPPERRAQVRTFRAIALFARTFRGWRKVLRSGEVF